MRENRLQTSKRRMPRQVRSAMASALAHPDIAREKLSIWLENGGRSAQGELRAGSLRGVAKVKTQAIEGGAAAPAPPRWDEAAASSSGLRGGGLMPRPKHVTQSGGSHIHVRQRRPIRRKTLSFARAFIRLK
jgi:hypothetical protein